MPNFSGKNIYRKGLGSHPPTYPLISAPFRVWYASSSEVKLASRVLTFKKKAAPRGLLLDFLRKRRTWRSSQN
jgi:hypothetical protein